MKIFFSCLALCFLLIVITPDKRSSVTTAPRVSINTSKLIIPGANDAKKIKNQPEAIDTAQLKQSGWYAQAMHNIALMEYSFSKGKKQNEWYSFNRRNNLKFHYNDKGFTVQPAMGDHPIWEIAFDLDKEQVG